MTPDAKLRMDVYQEGQRAFNAGTTCPYTDWRAGTWEKGRKAAEAYHDAVFDPTPVRAGETFSLEDGKYEFERDERGLMTAARRNGEPWTEGFEMFQFSKVFHAALNEIASLRDKAWRYDELFK